MGTIVYSPEGRFCQITRHIIVSGYFWHKSANSIGRDEANQWNMERTTRIQSAPNDEHGLLMELEFSACYMEALGAWNYQQRNILEMKYEEMVSNHSAFFSTAFEFIGLPPVIHNDLRIWWGITLNRVALKLLSRPLVRVNTLPKLILNQSLEKLSFEKQSPGRRNGVANPGHKYRKGVAGDWRNHFTPRVTAAFRERYGQLLLQLAYEEDDNWS